MGQEDRAVTGPSTQRLDSSRSRLPAGAPGESELARRRFPAAGRLRRPSSLPRSKPRSQDRKKALGPFLFFLPGKRVHVLEAGQPACDREADMRVVRTVKEGKALGFRRRS